MNTVPVVPSAPNLQHHAENLASQPVVAPISLDVAAENTFDQENISNQTQVASEPALVMPDIEAVAVPTEDIAVKPDNNMIATETTTVPVEPNSVLRESAPSKSVQAPLSDQTQQLEPDAIKKIIGEMVDRDPDSLGLPGLADLAKKVGEVGTMELGE